MKKRILCLLLAILLLNTTPLFSGSLSVFAAEPKEAVVFDYNCDTLTFPDSHITNNKYPSHYFADSQREDVEAGTVYMGGNAKDPGYSTLFLPFTMKEESFSLEMQIKVDSLMVPAKEDIWTGMVFEINTPSNRVLYLSFHGIKEPDEKGSNAVLMVMKDERSDSGAYVQNITLPTDDAFHTWDIRYDGQGELRFYIDSTLIGAFSDITLAAVANETRLQIKNIHLSIDSGVNAVTFDNIKLTSGITMEKTEIAYAGAARDSNAKALTVNTHLTDVKKDTQITVTVTSEKDPTKTAVKTYHPESTDSAVTLTDIPFSGMTEIALSVTGGVFTYTFPYYLFADTESLSHGDVITSDTPDTAYRFSDFARMEWPEKSQWKPRYYKLSDGTYGVFASHMAQNNGAALTIPVTLNGKFAVYIGYAYGTKGLAVNETALDFTASDGIEDTICEAFALAGDFSGTEISLRPLSSALVRIAYVKFVSLSDEKYEKYLAEDDSHHLMTDNDGYSIFCAKGYDNPDTLINSVITSYAENIEQRQFNWCVFVTTYLNYDSPVWWDYITRRLEELDVPKEKYPKNFLDRIDKKGNYVNYDLLMLDIDKTAFSNMLAINEHGAPHEILSDYVKKNDYGELFVSLRMSAFYSGDWAHLNGTFYHLYPEWVREGGPQFSYVHEEYRHYLHDLLIELASYKNVDGVTMDFGRYYYIFGTELEDVQERTRIMNDFVRSVSEDLPEGKELNVRVLNPTEEKAAAWGLDYKYWVENDLVDRVIISDQGHETFFDFTKYTEFFNRHDNAEFYLGINATLTGHDMTKEEEEILKAGGTIPKTSTVGKTDILLRAYKAYMAGADGIFFFNGLGRDKIYTNLNNKTLMEKWYEFEYPADLVSSAFETVSKKDVPAEIMDPNAVPVTTAVSDAADTTETTAGTEQPAPSRTPVYIGIGAAVLIAAASAVLLLKKKNDKKSQ